MQDNSSNKLEYLRFLLESSEGPRFLFVVCDEAAQQRTYMKEIYAPLKKHNTAVLDVVALDPSSILEALVTISHKEVKSINLVGAATLGEPDQKALFSHLNFHRDAISEIGLPLLLWLTSESLTRFAATAPDFWSRRTAVVRLSESPAAERIRALFSGYKPPNVSAFEADMRQSFATVSHCEKELQECLQGEHFSIARIDGKIAKLRQAISVFLSWIERGRALQVTLWMWNALQLDSAFQRRLQNALSSTTAQPDTLLDHRNEVLVQVSANLSTILEEYRESIVECCKNGRRINLRTRILNEVDSALKVVVCSEGEETLSSIDIDHRKVDLLTVDSGAENQLRNKAATQLDLYLSGAASVYPRFFAPDEIRMLKFLYENRQSIPAFARQFGVSEADASQKVQGLYEKVMLYLGEV